MSEEVKIWQARYKGDTWVLAPWQNGLRFGVNSKGIVRLFDTGTPFTNLTELTFHPKGEGMWIEGENARNDLANFLKMAKQRAEERDYGLIIEERIDSILAQLTPSALAVVGAEIKQTEEVIACISPAEAPARAIWRNLQCLRALRTVIEKCAPNGYTTWDRSMVPMVDGEYDPIETEKWELAHGHDIRLKCFPEFGCQLWIDPEDLLTDVKKELGI